MSQRLHLLQQLLTQTPNDTFALFAIAKEYESVGNQEQALSHYLQLRDIDPDYVGLYYHLGKLYAQTGHPEEALQVFRDGMAVAKKLGDTHSFNELNGARMELDDSDDDF